MNRASMVKCRIPDTHYRPRVKEMEHQAQSERHGEKEKETECVGEILYSEGLTFHYTLITAGQHTVNVSSVHNLRSLDSEKGSIINHARKRL